MSHHPAAVAMLTPLAVKTSAGRPNEQDHAMPLPAIEALVKRVRGIRELLQRGAALRHRISAEVQPLDEIRRTVGAGARSEQSARCSARSRSAAFTSGQFFSCSAFSLGPACHSAH